MTAQFAHLSKLPYRQSCVIKSIKLIPQKAQFKIQELFEIPLIREVVRAKCEKHQQNIEANNNPKAQHYCNYNNKKGWNKLVHHS